MVRVSKKVTSLLAQEPPTDPLELAIYAQELRTSLESEHSLHVAAHKEARRLQKLVAEKNDKQAKLKEVARKKQDELMRKTEANAKLRSLLKGAEKERVASPCRTKLRSMSISVG